MIQRIFTLVDYFGRSLSSSLAGVLYILLALVFWWLFFDPSYGTPHIDYYILMICVFGAGFTFLVTSTLAARANHAMHYPMLVRLSSRPEYLVAVLISALGFAIMGQLLVAILATFRGPSLTLGWVVKMPIIWLPINILAGVMALHASDLVTVGWSRVYLYSGLLACYFGQKLDNVIGRTLDFVVFWPFRAVAEAIRAGFFKPAQALTPLIFLLYAALLFALAARLFTRKNLDMIE